MKAKFHGEWSSPAPTPEGWDIAIAESFGGYSDPSLAVLDALKGATLLFARYTYEDYSGDARVIWRKRGKLYEVTGGHCSCHGLEGQWKPGEVTAKSLAGYPNPYRSDYGGYRDNKDAAEAWDKMIAWLAREEKRSKS